jgi:nicotinamide mononucleotide transporter
VNPVEATAAALGVLNVVLLIRRSVWNYPVAIGMVCLYAIVFYGARLYSDVALQAFFVGINVYGWRHWLQARGAKSAVPVRWMLPRQAARSALLTGAGWLLWSTAMARLTDAAAPYWDGAVAALSVTAQVLLARRFVENWVYWMVVNGLAVGLFWTRDLRLTAALYALFFVMAIAGFARWRDAAAR